MSHYKYTITSSPDFALLNVEIPAQQSLKVEASAMASMDSHISMRTRVKGGLSRFLSRESIFINEFTAHGGRGRIQIAPGPAGDLSYHSITESGPIFLTGTSFVAATPDVTIDTKFQGIVKGFFSGESLFLMYCSGKGDLWFNTYGGLFTIDVEDEYIVDTGHIVAFTEGLDYSVSRIGGYKSLFFSGEGFICRFKGKGKVWIQSRNPLGLIAWAQSYRIVQNTSN